MLTFIHWNADPEIFTLGPLTVRWYGLLFALGFLLGQQLLIRMFKGEGKPESDVEVLTVYMVLSTIIGARLGHMLFYDFADLKADPLVVFRIWEGGLASHGAGMVIFPALYLYTHYGIAFFHEGKLLHVWKRQKPGQSFLWVTDRIAVTVALAGCCIRLGNLMNSEIIGKQTDAPWAFIFEKVDLVPRHPAQLYEAITCLILLFILYAYWKRRKEHTPEGSITALFMIYIFTLRFFYEFLKEPQVDFENDLIQDIGLNMGQILSIPAVAFGIFLWVYSRRQARHVNA